MASQWEATFWSCGTCNTHVRPDRSSNCWSKFFMQCCGVGSNIHNFKKSQNHFESFPSRYIYSFVGYGRNTTTPNITKHDARFSMLLYIFTTLLWFFFLLSKTLAQCWNLKRKMLITRYNAFIWFLRFL